MCPVTNDVAIIADAAGPSAAASGAYGLPGEEEVTILMVADRQLVFPSELCSSWVLRQSNRMDRHSLNSHPRLLKVLRLDEVDRTMATGRNAHNCNLLRIVLMHTT